MQNAPPRHVGRGLHSAEANIDDAAPRGDDLSRCHLWTLGTQTVFGEGPKRARVVIVGSNPAIRRIARSSVRWPAGKLLDRALDAAESSATTYT